MVRSADFIQHKVPVDPIVHAVVQIPNDIVCVLFGMAQGVSGCRAIACQFHTALAVHQHQIRVIFFYHGKGVKMIAGIPVICNTGNHVFCRLIYDISRSLVRSLFVMIPDIQFYMLQAFFF